MTGSAGFFLRAIGSHCRINTEGWPPITSATETSGRAVENRLRGKVGAMVAAQAGDGGR